MYLFVPQWGYSNGFCCFFKAYNHTMALEAKLMPIQVSPQCAVVISVIVTNCRMGFLALQHVQPKMTAHPGQHLKQEAKPSDTIGCALHSKLAEPRCPKSEEQPCAT